MLFAVAVSVGSQRSERIRVQKTQYHLIIVYPDLGHGFVPSNQWVTSYGQMEEYVFQDMFEWLTSPARDQ